MAIFGLYIFMAMAIMAGVAIDTSNLFTARTQLQITADMAAHAALYTRDTEDAATARLAALEVVEATMPQSRYGIVLTAEDIQFGYYDRDSDTFTVDNDSRDAVLVTSTRLSEKANPVSSFLLQFAGLSNWDIGVQSVFTTFRPACFREGFVADGVVDLQSNNAYTNGFCIHSNSHVSLNSNNTFEAGTVVSMPNTTDLELPTSGWETNEGLDAALRSGAYRLRIINKLYDIIDGLANMDPEYLPDYIDATQPPVSVRVRNGRGLSMADLTPNRVNIVGCHSNGVLTLNNGQSGTMTINNVVILAACELKLDQSLIIEDAIIATTNPYIKSITASSNVQIGRNDNCASGGSAQILSLGGMEFSSGLSIFGSQLLAEKDIVFTANADGIQGASIVSGGVVSGTSNMNMGFCGTGMENNFEAEYFRLAR
ncbi:hypothetical protein EU803_03440 [Loktanella sp. IMCC34160]|nr:hypothetical protein EU803_03440 [Loktanella sp. IMCC34160]